eukprot:m.135528 g.135528  ORF g.135528 m.135528 type:complete len:122 (+) comp10063_c0_seq1:897-1262(+)
MMHSIISRQVVQFFMSIFNPKLHAIEWVDAKKEEKLLHHNASGTNKEETVNVDLNYVSFLILAHTVALVIKCREGCTQVIQVVAKAIRHEITLKTVEKLWKTHQVLAQFDFPLMVNNNVAR